MWMDARERQQHRNSEICCTEGTVPLGGLSGETGANA